ncbi:unnamed protein product [Vitrella brassicaformis CCMP3155]|uniref:poly(ADP-ribose) glycohydrolase n=1 Tax=Vitrella brassicaformis (strain CCMP3155) TaxID=1169540 RepID=A0A0G4GM91_VITBC|nr:unnamed protein product [Vitrella brassicaformis CCMP3155]|eukprot:CEM31316.1 unnamed protein product [Vitrella brassicaformis CCMP3155]
MASAGSRTIADALRACDPRDILDMSCREPVTNSPFGHTAVTKLEIFRRIRQLGMRNVAALAWYDDYCPVEDQFLQLLMAEEPRLNGIVVMFPAGDQSALAKLRASSIPNVFIDVYLSPRNQRGAVDASVSPQTHIQQTLQSILEHFKAINRQRQPPPINLDGKYRYHIYVNLVDLCDAPIGTPATDATIAYLKGASAVVPNVTHICFEEFRGNWTHEKYGEVAALLRSHFPRGRYKLLVHAHAGAAANDTGASTLEAVKHGADGIWSAFLPDAAQIGHNSSIRFLSDLWHHDHPTVDHYYSFDKMIPLARELHELSFPGVAIDPLCPIYGVHASAWVNQAFRHQDNSPHAFPAQLFGGCNRSRIAPMISDDATIAGRVGEVVGRSFTRLPLERQHEVARRMRRCMHAVLADGRRYDFDNPAIVKWIYRHVCSLRADEEVTAPSAQTAPLPAILDSQPLPGTQRVVGVPMALEGDTAMADEQNMEIDPYSDRSSDASEGGGDASAIHPAPPSTALQSPDQDWRSRHSGRANTAPSEPYKTPPNTMQPYVAPPQRGRLQNLPMEGGVPPAPTRTPTPTPKRKTNLHTVTEKAEGEAGPPPPTTAAVAEPARAPGPATAHAPAPVSSSAPPHQQQGPPDVIPYQPAAMMPLVTARPQHGQASAASARAAPEKLPSSSAHLLRTDRASSSFVRPPPPDHGSPANVKAILTHHATRYGRVKEPKDVTRLLSMLQSVMGTQGISSTKVRGLEKMMTPTYISETPTFISETPTFIDETLPVLCAVLSKSEFSFPLLPPSSHPHSTMERKMTARQCFALVGAGFLCLHKHSDGSLNFDRLFDNHTPSGKAKLECLIHYLNTMARAIRQGNITETERVVIFQALDSPGAGLQDLAGLTAPLMDVHFIQGTSESIFTSNGIRGDFANAHIGGGTLEDGLGAMEEEILFSTEPECLVARYLFPRPMGPTEAFMIVGSKTFSKTTRYGRGPLRFAGPAHDTATMRHIDGHPVLSKYIVAFDAVNFGKQGGGQQYDETCVLRELNKAYTAFHCNSLTVVSGMPFATGNWGCGVFGGDPQWKFLIQWCAASLAGRQLQYYPRGEQSLIGAEDFMHRLKDAGCRTVGGLVQLMCDGRTRRAVGPHMSAFDAVMTTLMERSRPSPPPLPRTPSPPPSLQQHWHPPALADLMPPPQTQEARQHDKEVSAAPPKVTSEAASGDQKEDESPREGGCAPMEDTTDTKSSVEGDDDMDIDTAKAAATDEETTPLLSAAQKSGDSMIDHIFKYVPTAHTRPSKVELKGSFDGWHGEYPMHWSAGEHNCFVLPFPLPPGRYTYKFIVDGRWVFSSKQPTDQDRDGNANNVVVIG